MLKFSLEKISSGKQNPFYDGFYTPHIVKIADLNDDTTSVPWYKKP